jgi:hypothetical protein
MLTIEHIMLTRLTSRYREEPCFAGDEQDLAPPVPRLRSRVAQAARGSQISFDILRSTARLGRQDFEARGDVNGVESLEFRVYDVQFIWLTLPRSPKLQSHHQQDASYQ